MLQEVYQVTASMSRALAFLIFPGLVQIFTFFPSKFPQRVFFSGPGGGGANYFQPLFYPQLLNPLSLSLVFT